MHGIAKAIFNIEESMRKKERALDLSYCILGEIPNEALKVAFQIKELNLSGNKSIDITSLSIFDNIEVIILSDCGFFELPKILYEIRNLKKIILSKNPIEKIDNNISNLNNLIHIDLSNTNIDSLPNGIKNLNQLKSIDLSNCKFREFPYHLFSLPNIKIINIDNNFINSIIIKKENIQKDSKLSYLSIRGNRIRLIPNEIIYFYNLKRLSLSNNKIIKIPEFIEKIHKLEYLELNNNVVEEIPTNFTSLDRISKIDLSWNKIKLIPIEIITHEQLGFLEIYGNPIEFPPYKVAKDGKHALENWLNGLRRQIRREVSFSKNNNTLCQSIDLSNMYLCYIGIPDDLFRLTSIIDLDLSNNSLFKIDSGIINLINLESIDISRNRLGSIPDEIYNLYNLKIVDVSHNDINYVPEIISEIVNLEKLDLSYNNIVELPQSISSLDFLSEIYLEGNPIVTPPVEIVSQGIKAIKAYFESIQDLKDTEYLYEAKLIFVGNGRVGKTSLRKSLKNDNYFFIEGEEESTEGLEVDDWIIPITIHDKQVDFKFNVWDFGGQGRYRAIQQFFCSTKSLYVFVTQPRDQEINRNDPYTGFNYWLSFVNTYSYEKKSGKKSPVIAVVNKVDLDGDRITKKELEINFDNIKDFVETSCKSGEGIDLLKTAIGKHILDIDVLEFNKKFAVNFSKKWLAVKEELEELRKTQDIIDYYDYLKLCEEHQVNKTHAEVWIEYLHLIGNVLRFKNIDLLENKIILDPNWARKIAFSAIDSEIVKNNNGWFAKDDLDKLWEEKYNKHQCLSLLKAFDLVFEVGRGNQTRYFVPVRFPEYPPEDFEWNFEENVYYECRFTPFIPAGIASRLIVSLSDEIHYFNGKRIQWLNGAVFQRINDEFEESNYTLAFVEENWRDNKIEIKLKGIDAVMLNITLSEEIARIVRSIKEQKFLFNLSFDEYVMYKDNENNDVYEFSYKPLLNTFRSGLFAKEVDLNFENSTTVGEILTGSQINEAVNDYILAYTARQLSKIKQKEYNKRIMTKIRSVFISYNHADGDLAESIRRNLIADGINVIMDRHNMAPGEKIDRFIENSIQSSDYTISIISEKSLASTWVVKEFIITSYKMLGNHKKKLIPCFLDKKFLEREFVDFLFDKIEVEINDINLLKIDRAQKGRSSRDLESDLSRYKDYHTKIDEIFDFIKNSLCIDFSEKDKYDTSMLKLINAIKSN